jgi:hypothetical protein
MTGPFFTRIKEKSMPDKKTANAVCFETLRKAIAQLGWAKNPQL